MGIKYKKNHWVGMSRAFTLMLFFDCLILILINFSTGLNSINWPYLIVGLIIDTILFFFVFKFFKNGMRLHFSDVLYKVIMVTLLILTSFITVAVFGSSHNLHFSTYLGYSTLFILSFLGAARSLSPDKEVYYDDFD